MKIFNGKNEALLLDAQIISYVKTLEFVPKLAIVQIGDDPVSTKYIQLKSNLALKLGIDIELHKFNKNTSITKLKDCISQLAINKDISGIIMQLPLPSSEHYKLLEFLPKSKDVDVLNLKPFVIGSIANLSPVVRSFLHFIKYADIDLANCETIVIGEGRLVGQPILEYLEVNQFKYHLLTDYLKGAPLNCDLLILGTGIPNLVKGDILEKQTNVIDFGTSSQSGTLVGDFDTNSDLKNLNYFSPSPGGMGPLVIRYLFMNLLNI